jgi:hypothetical protein
VVTGRLWNIDRLLFVEMRPASLLANSVRIDAGIPLLIRRMNRENPLWGAPRIHGELLMLGIEVAVQLSAGIWSGAGDHRLKVGGPSCAITLPGSRPSTCS